MSVIKVPKIPSDLEFPSVFRTTFVRPGSGYQYSVPTNHTCETSQFSASVVNLHKTNRTIFLIQILKLPNYFEVKTLFGFIRKICRSGSKVSSQVRDKNV
jgi:hypothetical protein